MDQKYNLRIKLLLILPFLVGFFLMAIFFLFYAFFDRSFTPVVGPKQITKNPTEKIKFLVFGDSGSGSNEQKILARLMEKESPDLILHTGDLAYERGTPMELKEKALFIYQKLFDQASFYPVLGNHDYLTQNGQPFLDIFKLPGNERYYFFSVGKNLFIALDSNALLDEAPNKMLSWLEQTLSRNVTSYQWVFVYFHHPAYSTGSHGSDKRVQDKIVPILEKYSVDMVFSGHDHNYQRTCEIKQGKCENGGIVYLVTGGGGKSLYPVGRPDWFTKFQKSVYHFLSVKIENCRLTLETIDLNGAVFDKVEKAKC